MNTGVQRLGASQKFNQKALRWELLLTVPGPFSNQGMNPFRCGLVERQSWF